MIKIKSMQVLAFVFVIALTAGFIDGHAAEQSSLTTGQSSKLLARVGQKCSLILRTGARVKGTLWDFDDTSITIKVKKGLLYSKTEQHKIADIDYFEDASGVMIRFSGNGQAAPKAPPATLIFSIDDTQPAETPEDEKSDHEAESAETSQKQSLATEEQELEKMLNRIAGRPEARDEGESRRDGSSRTEQRKALSGQPAASKTETIPSLTRTGVVAAREQSKGNAQESGSEAERTSTGPAPASSASAGHDLADSRKQTQTAGTEVAPPVRRAERRAGQRANAAGAEMKKLRVLRYQTLILFGVAAIAIMVVILTRILGMKSKATAKNTLFPSKLVKVNGRFGILDQGLEDGIKVDDVVRLYRKIDSKIFYRGAVRVRKVAENYAMVEVMRKKKGVRLQVGDVGVRDRNIVAASLKRLRIFLSRMLRGIGRIFMLTARGVAVKDEAPTIEFDLTPDVESMRVQQIPGREVTVVNTESDGKKVSPSRPQKGFGFDLD